MAVLSTLFSVLFASSASATILFSTAYNDHSLNILDFNGSSLSTVAKNYDCGSEPTWLTVNRGQRALYCLNEGWGGSASITSYFIANNGASVEKRQVLPTLKSPVASTIFGSNQQNIAVAYYDTSSVAFYSYSGSFGSRNPYSLRGGEPHTFNLSAPGVVPERQEAPHPHHVIQDPRGRYVVIPDLGADLLRWYYFVEQSGAEVTSIKSAGSVAAVPGSGPRHGAFVTRNQNTFFYSINELSNSISGYRVGYVNGFPPPLPNVTRIFDISTHGVGGSVPKGTKAAEIQISPDSRFLLVSSRGENRLTASLPGSQNVTSDPIITFAINPLTGTLTHVQTAAAGGRNPRHFSLNKAGTLVASALQDDNRVVIIERDVKTGLLGKIVATETVGVGEGNGPNFAMFYE